MKPVFYIIMKLFYTNFAFIANDLIIKLLINLYKNNNYNIFFKLNSSHKIVFNAKFIQAIQ